MAAKPHKKRKGQGAAHRLKPYALRYALICYTSPYNFAWGIVEYLGFDRNFFPVSWRVIEDVFFDKSLALKKLKVLEAAYQDYPKKFITWEREDLEDMFGKKKKQYILVEKTEESPVILSKKPGEPFRDVPVRGTVNSYDEYMGFYGAEKKAIAHARKALGLDYSDGHNNKFPE